MARCVEPATVWLLNRMSNDWADYGLRPALKAAGIYDPDSVKLREAVVPPPPAGSPRALDRRDRPPDRRRRAREERDHAVA